MQVTRFGKDLGRIEKLTVEKGVNQHSYCRFDFLVTNNKVDNESRLPAVGSIVDIIDDQNDDRCLRGKIQEICIHRSIHGMTLQVSVVSLSIAADEEKNKRIFQSTDKTYDQVAQKLTGYGLSVVWDKELKNKKIEEVVLQQDLTDFEFINKLAAENECFVYVDDTADGDVKLIVKKSLTERVKDVQLTDIYAFQEKITSKGAFLTAELNGDYELGSRCKIFGNAYTIVGKTIAYQMDYTKYTYEAIRDGQRKKKKTKQTENSLLPIGLAQVVDNKDPENLGRIRVKYLDIEDCLTSQNEKSKYQWIDYLTPLSEAKGGMVWIPDKDEYVEVFCQNGKCIAMGCRRQNELDEKCRNVDERTLLIREKKLILAKDRIELLAWNETQRLTIKEKDMELEMPQYLIRINEDGLLIQNNTKNNGSKTEIDLTKGKIKIIAGQELEVEGNGAKGRFDSSAVTIDKGSKLEVGSKVAINASSGVEVTTSSFKVN